MRGPLCRLVLICGLLLLAAAPAWAEALRSEPHCQVGLFCLRAEREGEAVALRLESFGDRLLTLVIRVEADRLEGPDEPLRLVLRQSGDQILARYRIAKPGAWKLAWDYSFHPGEAPAPHNPESPYRLPYPPGAAYRVIQGAEGAFSHQGAESQAIDWAMPEGSPVTAARAGRVLGLRDGQPDILPGGGPDPALKGQENYIWIEHRDGTVGQYLHLQAGSFLVREGEEVAAGQPLARSGNSGFSSQPHLHFQVSSVTEPAAPEAFETFPLLFDLGDGRGGQPLSTGESYGR